MEWIFIDHLLLPCPSLEVSHTLSNFPYPKNSPILQMGKLGFKEIEWLRQDHKAEGNRTSFGQQSSVALRTSLSFLITACGPSREPPLRHQDLTVYRDPVAILSLHKEGRTQLYSMPHFPKVSKFPEPIHCIPSVSAEGLMCS